ncbi:C40 family peptidase [Corynebacterium suicordis]
MNLLELIQALAQLAPSPLSAGHTALPRDTDLDLAREIPVRLAGALEGEAGAAIERSLSQGADDVQQALEAGSAVDRIARRAEQVVDSAIQDITVIAQECLQACAAAVVSSLTSGGVLGGMAAARVPAIVDEYWLRAHERLAVLGRELSGLTGEINGVSFPDVGAGPKDASITGNPQGAVGSALPASPAAAETPALLSSTDSTSPGVPPIEPGHSDSSTVDPALPSPTDADTAVVGAPSPEAAKAVEAARSALGTPYQWGGTAPGVGLDCSGLTQWAYSQAGVEIPRTAQQQAMGTPVDASNLLPGDLAVWDGHVAMLTGDGQMIEAGDPVQISPVRTENIGMNFLGFYRPAG